MARECPNGDCVIAKTEQFLAVLEDPNADKNAKAQALKFVIHFVGDLHQPLHDEDNGDKGGNTRHVIFDGTPWPSHRCDSSPRQRLSSARLTGAAERLLPDRLGRKEGVSSLLAADDTRPVSSVLSSRIPYLVGE